ncbi:MAG TPA: hypothetical protein VFW11_14655 [Cyclobacteriaceae bacterium]|nr:hypothetical protein [Cyclobacteriaceae bacterium]
MRERSNTSGLIAGLGLTVTVFISTFSVQAQSRIFEVPSIRSTKDYVEAEKLIDAIANELYKAYQLYPEFAYDIEYESNGEMAVTVTGIDNHTIANRIANQIIVLEDIGKAISNVDENFLPEPFDMNDTDMLNEQQAEAYQPNVEVSEGFTNVLYIR